ncbi:F-box/LRR-repeat protein [Reticulomyxa filosa]|uniref:F-box/LRR-repeat protein n=1 Tax=Reticulomyxa filosa TaxID=46433 RepID=X6LRS7_RETFI|nr:F-box/LRR-repeat protein [Reticulomyxa filosa]|eukprot:ETO04329.1 F-box/LRR-repeat protein [Reticulomyxa filosa]
MTQFLAFSTIHGLEKECLGEVKELLHEYLKKEKIELDFLKAVSDKEYLSTRRGYVVLECPSQYLNMSLFGALTKLKSVQRIIYLVGEFVKLPMDDTMLSYLQTEITSNKETNKKWQQGHDYWKSMCLATSLNYLENDSVDHRFKSSYIRYIEANKGTDESKTDKQSIPIRELNVDEPTYRITCDRIGSHVQKTDILEPQLAHVIHTQFPTWQVKLSYPDIHIYFDLFHEQCLFGIILRDGMHRRNRRNLQHHFQTALNPCLCYLLARIADIKPHMYVCDPMCGIGSILIESFLSYPHATYIGTDWKFKPVQEAICNTKYCNIPLLNTSDLKEDNINDEQKYGICFTTVDVTTIYPPQCNSIYSKLKNKIDVVITDPPFGHKHGTYQNNREHLYPKMIKSLMSLIKPVTGKLLMVLNKATMERKLVKELLQQMYGDEGCKYETKEVDIGGFNALLFIIQKLKVEEDTIEKDTHAPKKKEKKEKKKTGKKSTGNTSHASNKIIAITLLVLVLGLVAKLLLNSFW